MTRTLIDEVRVAIEDAAADAEQAAEDLRDLADTTAIDQWPG